MAAIHFGCVCAFIYYSAVWSFIGKFGENAADWIQKEFPDLVAPLQPILAHEFQLTLTVSVLSILISFISLVLLVLAWRRWRLGTFFRPLNPKPNEETQIEPDKLTDNLPLGEDPILLAIQKELTIQRRGDKGKIILHDNFKTTNYNWQMPYWTGAKSTAVRRDGYLEFEATEAAWPKNANGALLTIAGVVEGNEYLISAKVKQGRPNTSMMFQLWVHDTKENNNVTEPQDGSKNLRMSTMTCC